MKTTRIHLLRALVISSVTMAVLSSLYIGRCWYVSSHIQDSSAGAVWIATSRFTWLAPSFNTTPHFHLSYDVDVIAGSGEVFYYNKCIHLWKSQKLHRERHLSFGATPLLDDMPNQCHMSADPSNGWVTAWVPFE